jgi:hypothetical protein
MLRQDTLTNVPRQEYLTLERNSAGPGEVQIAAFKSERVGRARFELAVSWSQTRRFSELSYRPRASIEPDTSRSAPDSSSARTALARWLYFRFSSGGISPNVLPVPGTRKMGS